MDKELEVECHSPPAGRGHCRLACWPPSSLSFRGKHKEVRVGGVVEREKKMREELGR